MSFIQSVKRCFINCTNFKGRASRADYWFFYLFDIIVFNVFSVIQASYGSGGVGLELLNSLLIMLAIVTGITYLAVGVRRLHDVDRSGWWLLLAFTVIGIILLFYWQIKAGDKEANRFGERPLS